jgi:acyl-CoA reductase-like NAD-dependent aldehyde dehydrogenase
MIDQNSLFIDGILSTAHAGDRIEVLSAATEEVIGCAPDADTDDVDAAVAAARRAFDDPRGWSAWTADDRAAAIERLADELEARAPRLTELVSSQNGMPIAIAGMLESGLPTTVYRYYANLVRTTELEQIRPGLLGGRAIVRQAAVGVVAAVVPWNYPNLVTALKVAPALAAGCTVVVKPSPETVLDSYVFADAVAAANIPAGVVNIVPGRASTGAHLVSHPDVDMVTFTGSTAVGRQIAKTCGELLRPVTLELGGKSAAIILDDADLAASIEGLFQATLLNNGQTCVLNGRILVPRNRFDESVDVFTALVNGVVVGDPLDPSTQVGPLVTDAHRTRVESHIAKAKADGARVLAGGGRPAQFDRGWYVQPTLFSDVDPSSSLAQEEVFGPVLALMPYDDVDHAVQIANDSAYGLAGTIWTADEARGIQIAERIESGTVGVNYYMLDPVAPFGGIKASGLGRELGPEGLAACMRTHTTYLSTTA